MLTHLSFFGVNDARIGYRYVISIGEQLRRLVMNVPQDNTIEQTDNELDIFYLAFGILRQAIIRVDRSMRRVVLPHTNFR